VLAAAAIVAVPVVVGAIAVATDGAVTLPGREGRGASHTTSQRTGLPEQKQSNDESCADFATRCRGCALTQNHEHMIGVLWSSVKDSGATMSRLRQSSNVFLGSVSD